MCVYLYIFIYIRSHCIVLRLWNFTGDLGSVHAQLKQTKGHPGPGDELVSWWPPRGARGARGAPGLGGDSGAALEGGSAGSCLGKGISWEKPLAGMFSLWTQMSCFPWKRALTQGVAALWSLRGLWALLGLHMNFSEPFLSPGLFCLFWMICPLKIRVTLAVLPSTSRELQDGPQEQESGFIKNPRKQFHEGP